MITNVTTESIRIRKMKSTPEQLVSRGFVSEAEYLDADKDLTKQKIDACLNSHKAGYRTLAVRKIKQSKATEYIETLCAKLKTEKKLYTKIEICECLISFGEKSVKPVVDLLGQIGNNQHKKAVMVDLNKKSYPLPRDIAARILSNIGPVALPELQRVVTRENNQGVAEAIEAIGWIAFNYGDYALENDLIQLYQKNTDELIRWKLIRAFQGFPTEAIKKILAEIIQNKTGNQIIIKEAERSLLRIQEKRRS